MVDKMNPRTERARKAIVEAAFELASACPVDQITLTDIAKEAGVSRPTVYKQFSDTANLIAFVTESSLDDALSLIDREIDDSDAQTYFRDLMRRFVAAVYERKDFYRHAIYGPSAAQIMIGVAQMLDSRMSTRLVGKRLSDAGDDADDCRAAISAGVVWLLVRWLGSDFQGENAPERIAERIADVMFVLSGAGS